MSITVESRDGATQPVLPLTWQPPAAPAAVSLIARAQRGLVEAEGETDPAPRLIAAYQSALRAAAAVLAARGRPHRGRSRPASVWVLLPAAAPEFAEWAAFFAANSAAHAAAQAGNTRRITADSADELLRGAGQFVELAHGVVHGGARTTRRDAGRQAPCAAPRPRRARG
ncbi:SAV_6107 family HEPN domain-containing protein [Amycolatopsis aidingensis]|uniref:SAV_6107 family HEPN domain-containing protein n=1 Tax=Amycolatopsis aidingensis TaxID=2842453 RepID=UPI001C0D4574|nr:SAV_6107 family HEPN domain-containing protein [Amycolatopsis aidingensis]